MDTDDRSRPAGPSEVWGDVNETGSDKELRRTVDALGITLGDWRQVARCGSMSEWTAFVDSQLDPKRHTELEAHLTEGCRRCHDILKSLAGDWHELSDEFPLGEECSRVATTRGLNSLSREQFVGLCGELLGAEGYAVERVAAGCQEGGDLIAIEDYRSHAAADPVGRVRWHVRCEHQSGSGTDIAQQAVRAALHNYQASKAQGDGLMLIADTDYSGPARTMIEEHVQRHPDARVDGWDRRQLTARLNRHPHLTNRYGLPSVRTDYLSILDPLRELGSVRTVLISDQSAMAHNLSSALQRAGFDVTFLPFWNYLDPVRQELAVRAVSTGDIRLVVYFLGDSFKLGLPTALEEAICSSQGRDCSVLLFPFAAWSVSRGLSGPLIDRAPVSLQRPVAVDRAIGSSRRGDFRWLLAHDAFAEDRYVELDPARGSTPFTNGIQSRFGFSHTFEYLYPKPGSGAQVAWSDTTGNPVVVTSERSASRICYFNTCCHSCMTPDAIPSPLEAAPEMAILTRNILEWLLRSRA